MTRRASSTRIALLIALSGGTACTQGGARAASPSPPAAPPSSTAPAAAPSPPPSTPRDFAAPTLKAIARDPAAWVDQDASVTGTLQNEGTNYFTDLRVVLKDAEGHAIAVKPWLPAALPPGPKAGAPRPPTLAQFLGKTVTLRATVRRGEIKGAAKPFYLEVKEARPAE